MSWFLQSLKDHDTHRGILTRGSVSAACGIRFVPRTVAHGRKALPCQPPDPDQVCPTCQRAEPSPQRDE
ncbi:MAG: hypothetical protein ACT4NP_05225 [Pseudonocardiales bacterium]